MSILAASMSSVLPKSRQAQDDMVTAVMAPKTTDPKIGIACIQQGKYVKDKATGNLDWLRYSLCAPELHERGRVDR